MRLTALYGALFVVSGAVLLAITSGVVVSSSRVSVDRGEPGQSPRPRWPRHQVRIHQLQDQLATAEAQIHSGVSHDLLVGSAIALGIMTVVSLVLGWLVAGRVLRPLRLMTAATRRISADSLHERLAVAGPGDELKDLADTIDGLLERLEGAFAAQRRFVANASHELRTPLTTMRASVDVAVAKPGPVPAQTIALADRLRGELDRVDGLLDGFLALARAQHGDLPGQATLSLEYLTAAALAVRAGPIAARHLTVHHVTGHGRHLGDGQPGAAVPDGGQRARQRDRAQQGRRLDQRHHRGGRTRWPAWWWRPAGMSWTPIRCPSSPSRSGGSARTGPGLTTVPGSACRSSRPSPTAHGGTLDLRARPEGGLRVSIALPLAPAGRLAGAGVPG